MAAEFSVADHVTEMNEGGLANLQGDAGKLTYAGIASAYWPNWRGWPAVRAAMAAHNNGATRADVETINAILRADPATVALVNGFYLANFWNVNSLSQMPNQELANNVYDSSVNQGTGEAAHLLQDAVNDVLGAGTIASDGGIGPRTLAAVARCDQEALYNAMNAERLRAYKEDRGWAEFGETWQARLTSWQGGAA